MVAPCGAVERVCQLEEFLVVLRYAELQQREQCHGVLAEEARGPVVGLARGPDLVHLADAAVRIPDEVFYFLCPDGVSDADGNGSLLNVARVPGLGRRVDAAAFFDRNHLRRIAGGRGGFQDSGFVFLVPDGSVLVFVDVLVDHLVGVVVRHAPDVHAAVRDLVRLQEPGPAVAGGDLVHEVPGAHGQRGADGVFHGLGLLLGCQTGLHGGEIQGDEQGRGQDRPRRKRPIPH